MKIFALFYLFL